MIKEFREFLLRGNVVDLAVAVILGAAFGAVVTSFVNDILMQVVAIVFSEPDFSGLTLTINDSEIRYGAFLTVLINFVLTMAAVFFFLVKPVNALTERLLGPDEGGRPVHRECPQCLSEVHAAARRCAFCTSELTPVA